MSASGTGAINAITMIAAADLRTRQYGAVRISGDDLCNVASNPADKQGLGILYNKPNSGQAATVLVGGVQRLHAGGTITAGQNLTCNSAGRLVTATSGSFVFARALDGAVENEYFRGIVAPYFGGDL